MSKEQYTHWQFLICFRVLSKVFQPHWLLKGTENFKIVSNVHNYFNHLDKSYSSQEYLTYHDYWTAIFAGRFNKCLCGDPTKWMARS